MEAEKMERQKKRREDALPAFYLRLSKADGDKEESNSIENQRDILANYIGKMEDFGGSRIVDDAKVPYLEYIDDGYSGKDFNRPGFQKLITDCRKGKVSAILVKDLSRLGRDYIEVNSYLEDIFPFLHVRFISVSERYDSKNQKDDTLSIDMQIASLMNSYYLRDCAIKSAAGRVSKWKRGELASVQTPIGYTCESVETGWKVDPDGADIVRTVFELALTGISTGMIAREMNLRRIPTPYRYLKSKGLWRGGTVKSKEEKLVWDSRVVLNILKNESYTGMLVQGKVQAVVLGKGIRRKATDDMLFKHADKHEAIVSREDFEKAQDVIGVFPVKRAAPKGKEYMLKGVVRCSNCGRLMMKSTHSFSCIRKSQGEFTGCIGKWDEDEIMKAVSEQLNERSRYAGELLKRQKKPGYDIGAAMEEIGRLKALRLQKYEEYLGKKASREEFMETQKRIGEQIADIEGKIRISREVNAWREEVEDKLRPLAEAGENLTRETVERLIQNVWVGEDGIRVEFKADEMIRKVEETADPPEGCSRG